MKVDDVVVASRHNAPQMQSGKEIDVVANRKWNASYAASLCTLNKRAARIACEMSCMASTVQREREAEHLRFSAGKPAFGIDA